jgi:hypothetical protein
MMPISSPFAHNSLERAGLSSPFSRTTWSVRLSHAMDVGACLCSALPLPAQYEGLGHPLPQMGPQLMGQPFIVNQAVPSLLTSSKAWVGVDQVVESRVLVLALEAPVLCDIFLSWPVVAPFFRKPESCCH